MDNQPPTSTPAPVRGDPTLLAQWAMVATMSFTILAATIIGLVHGEPYLGQAFQLYQEVFVVLGVGATTVGTAHVISNNIGKRNGK
jgi:hypothetical protein